MGEAQTQQDLLQKLPNETKYRIATHLDNCSLAQLSRVSRSLVGAANCVLYKRDARAGGRDSLAIRAAVQLGCKATNNDQQNTASTIWERSLLYKANVNAQVGDEDAYDTPLMLAASSKTETQTLWVERLLNEGALASTESKKRLLDLAVDLGSLSLRVRANDKRQSSSLRGLKRELIESLEYCLPLLVPMIQNNTDACRLLLNRGSADLRLASPEPMDSGAAALTAIHVIAISGKDEMGFSEKMIVKFPHLVDAELPTLATRGITALHLAVLSLNKAVFPTLLRHRANVHSELGPLRRTPLHIAISQMHHDEEDGDLQTLLCFVRQLLDNGANADRPLPVGTGYTPLMTMLETMKMQTGYSKDWFKAIKATATLLLSNGADTNFIALTGATPLRMLTDIFMSQVSPQEVKAAAKQFIHNWIKEHGADLNFPVIGSSSLLGHVYLRHIDRGASQMEMFVKLKINGARFNALEANKFFAHWIPGNDLRDNYDMGYHRNDIEQSRIDKAYKKTFNYDTPEKILKEIKHLHARFDPPTDAAKLVFLALKECNYSSPLLAKVLSFEFHGRCVRHKDRTGYINHVVKLLTTGNKGYREFMAIRDCNTFIEHGASVQHRNKYGKKPIQVLRQFDNPSPPFKYTNLRVLLSDQEARETGQW